MPISKLNSISFKYLFLNISNYKFHQGHAYFYIYSMVLTNVVMRKAKKLTHYLFYYSLFLQKWKIQSAKIPEHITAIISIK